SSLTLSVMQATANSQLTLTVPASVAAHLRRPLVEWWTLGSTAMLGFVFLGIPATRRNAKKCAALGAMVFAMGFAIGGTMTGCGGSSSKPQTQPAPPPAVSNVVPGNYAVLITATPSGGTPQTFTLMLTVQ
ncbi:MAG: hypothetical protein ABI383_07615, partial [Acidobacteriaceae bacterium]